MRKLLYTLVICLVIVTGIVVFTNKDSKGSGGSGSSGGSSFTNKFGTASTVCAHSGCSRTIAKSGDTNCCTTHSNKCGNCKCYIDEDAMYCMTCLSNALS